MILEGNQRGGARDLALHLLKPENDRVEVYEVRGFVSEDLVSAFEEARAVSRGTRAKKFLFSLSLNPPAHENVTTEAFLDAIKRTEERLKLGGQPRAIVFHTKQGRRHCHAVWSRINSSEMKAIHLPHTRKKLMDLSRDLYFEHGWKMPPGFIRKSERDPNNFTLAQWQQAKRTGQDPRAIKHAFRDCWAASNNQKELQSALKDQGYVLAKGDRRTFVVLDHRCEVYSLPKWLGMKTRDAESKIDKPHELKSVDEVRTEIAKRMHDRLTALAARQDSVIQWRLSEIGERLAGLKEQHRREWESLLQTQTHRSQVEAIARQKRLRNGFGALVDWITGSRRKIKAENQHDAIRCARRDMREKDELTFKQLDQRRQLNGRLKRLSHFKEVREQELAHDIDQYRKIEHGQREKLELHRNEFSRG